MTIGYEITLAISLGLLALYFFVVKKKELWLGLLFVCVTIVNLGYFLMSIADTIEFAVFANDISYLGSVFLTTCMFMTILKLCGFEIKKSYIITCISLGALMFLIVATSPLLHLYYKDVWIEIIDGSAKLIKEYGPLHPLYLLYVLGYFVGMIVVIIHSLRLKKIASHKFSGMLAGVVCGNILVWLFEKFIHWDFEFLSVTYITSEILLLLLYWMMQDYVHVKDISRQKEDRPSVILVDSAERQIRVESIIKGLPEGISLSARQIDILEGILDGKSRKEIAADLHLSENTVKMHTSSLYKALGVSSREEIYALIK